MRRAMQEYEGPDIHTDSLGETLKSLEDIRAKLMEINRLCGYTERFCAMKREIAEDGWAKTLVRYHPDVNMDDPAAHELFALYKFVHDSMERSGDLQ